MHALLGQIHIKYNLFSLTVSHWQHPNKFGNHRYSNSGDVFNLSGDLTWPHLWQFMWIYGWKPLIVSHHLALFGCASGDTKYLTCQVTSKKKKKKVTELIFCHHPATFSDHRYCSSRDVFIFWSGKSA